VGDRLDVIGSGPVVADPTTYLDALGVLNARGLLVSHPAVAAHLSRGAAGELEETPKPGDPRLRRVTTRVIASNARVLSAISDVCKQMGFDVVRCEGGLEGSATEIARALVTRAAAEALRSRTDTPSEAVRLPRAWIAGGEPTVDARGTTGTGGPSQELALEAARLLALAPPLPPPLPPPSTGLWLWAFSTDGRDGPTEAAGAIVDAGTWAKIREAGIDPQRALDEHNSHMALNAARALIRTGATGTNLNHVWVIAEADAAGTSRAPRAC
jgi:glycerate-2-kinase